jgi:hypothetical protein
MQPTGRYVIVSFAAEQAAIVAQGETSRATFRRLFLTPYEFGGERHHPDPSWTVHGALVGSDESAVIAVPIWTWQGADGAPRFLCQATDDGQPPAISVVSISAKDLVEQLNDQLRSTGD